MTSMALARAAATPAGAGPLHRGPLFRSGGVVVLEGLVDDRMFAALCAEAQANYGQADRQVCTVVESDDADGRGGVPPRQLSTAGGGPSQDAVYHAPALCSLLNQLCGVPVRPSGSRGSYSYYVAPHDHLGLHLDIVTCDVTVIMVLTDSSPDDGGSLAVQFGGVGLPLSVLRRSSHAREDTIKAPVGSSIVLLGGLLPHRVLPITSGQRVISALCFEAVS